MVSVTVVPPSGDQMPGIFLRSPWSSVIEPAMASMCPSRLPSRRSSASSWPDSGSTCARTAAISSESGSTVWFTLRSWGASGSAASRTPLISSSSGSTASMTAWSRVSSGSTDRSTP